MAKPKKNSRENEQKVLDWLVESKALYITLIAFFVLYLLTRSILFPPLIAINILALFAAETIQGVQKEGVKHELVELATAVLVALVLWYGSSFILGTPAPLDAIVSCSMLPSLERGDMVLLQGAHGVKAPVVNLTRGEWQSIDWSDYSVICAGCQRPDGSIEPCLMEYDPLTGEYSSEANQSGKLLRFECGSCSRFNHQTGVEEHVPCTKGITISGTRIGEDLSNDVLVYTPQPGDTFKTEIIHRVYAVANVDGENYYFTKGDNNPAFDVQFGTKPSPQENTVGKVLFRLPYLGYVKLFLWGFYADPAGCEYVYQH